MMLDACGASRSSRGVTPFRLYVHVPYMPRHIRLLAAVVPGLVLKGVVCHFTTTAAEPRRVSASLTLPWKHGLHPFVVFAQGESFT